MYRVIQFCSLESHWAKCNRACWFPRLPKGQNSARNGVRSISGQENILFLLSWSMMVRHSLETTISFIAWKASWYFCVHTGNLFSQDFSIRAVKISDWIANFGRKVLRFFLTHGERTFSFLTNNSTLAATCADGSVFISALLFAWLLLWSFQEHEVTCYFSFPFHFDRTCVHLDLFIHALALLCTHVYLASYMRTLVYKIL